MKKVIGIPGWKTGDNSYGVTSNYLEYISMFGNPRIIMPWEELVKIDLLFLPGGLDINPLSYGEVPGFKTSNQDVFKQHFFDQRLENYIISGTPVFGVCLGFQQLNVHFGGKLTQDLPFHEQSSARWSKGHEVCFVGKASSKFEVNSHHHQGIVLENNDLSKELQALTISKDVPGVFTVVESFMHKTLKIAGTQWHPEEFYDEHASKLINELLK